MVETKKITCEFLKTLEKQHERIIFNRLKVELDKKNDLSNLGKNDFVDVLNRALKTVNSRALQKNKSMLKKFIIYCCKQGVMTQEQISMLGFINCTDIKIDVGNGLFKDFQHLWDTLEYDLAQMPNEEIYDTSRAIVYLTFYGVSKSELIELKKSDLKEDENIVIVGDREIKIDPYLMDFLSYYKNANGYQTTYMDGRICFFEYKKTKYLLRNRSSDKLTVEAILQAVSKLNKDIDGNFNLKKIERSGEISRAIESGKSLKYCKLKDRKEYQVFLNTFY